MTSDEVLGAGVHKHWDPCGYERLVSSVVLGMMHTFKQLHHDDCLPGPAVTDGMILNMRASGKRPSRVPHLRHVPLKVIAFGSSMALDADDTTFYRQTKT